MFTTWLQAWPSTSANVDGGCMCHVRLSDWAGAQPSRQHHLLCQKLAMRCWLSSASSNSACNLHRHQPHLLHHESINIHRLRHLYHQIDPQDTSAVTLWPCISNILTPSTLTIDRATSCRLPEYIRSVAIAPIPWHYVTPFLSPTLSLRPILRLHNTTGAARSSVFPTSYF